MYLYIIQNNQTKEIYIGTTNNLKSRLQQHNARGTKYTTREYGVWSYVYVEWYRHANDARERERRLKYHGSGKQELFKRITQSLI